MMQGSVLVLAISAALVPVGLAPDPAPVMPCLGLGMDREQIKECIKRDVERRVAALPPLPEQAGPPLWLCDSPECLDRLHISCVLRPPSQAAYEARQKALEAWRRKQALNQRSDSARGLGRR